MARHDNLRTRKKAALEGLPMTSHPSAASPEGVSTGWSRRVCLELLRWQPLSSPPRTSSGQACPKPSSVLFTQPPASSAPHVLNVLLKGCDLGNRERYRAGKGSVGLGRRFPSSTGEKQMKPSPHTLLKRKLSTRKLYISFKRQAMCWKYSHSRPSRGS